MLWTLIQRFKMKTLLVLFLVLFVYEGNAGTHKVNGGVSLFKLDPPISYLSALLRGAVSNTPHSSSVTKRENRSTRRNPEMFFWAKLDNTLLTCDQVNFNEITARSRNQTLVWVARDKCTTTVSPASSTFFPFIGIFTVILMLAVVCVKLYLLLR